MNTFVYGPKDDPLVRRRWREAYDRRRPRSGSPRSSRPAPRPASRSCTRSAPASRSATRPPRTRAVLLAKLEQVAALGVSRFALLLDDLPPDLAHDEDRAVYADLAEAHVRALDARSRPTSARTGASSSARSSTTAAATSRTSRASRRRSTRRRPDVDRARRSARRSSSPRTPGAFEATAAGPPLYWDNYPVNDVAMGWELHIGPYRGRDADLRTASRGVLANPMELRRRRRSRSRRSRTTSRTPRGYDPEASVARAIRDVAGDGSPTADATRRPSRRSPRTSAAAASADEDAPTVTAALATFAAAADDAAETGDTRALTEAAATCARSRSGCSRPRTTCCAARSRTRALIDECRPWIEAFEVGARAMCRAADLALEGSLPRDLATVTSCAAAVPRGAAPSPGPRVRGRARHVPRRHDRHPYQARETAPGRRRRASMNRKIARLALVGASAAMLLAACGGERAPGGERPRAAGRDGLARRGRRSASGTTSPRSSRRRIPDQGRDELPGRRPVRDHRSPDPAGRPNAPDIYFEWTGSGSSSARRTATPPTSPSSSRRGRSRACSTTTTLKGYTIDGKIVMVPYSADVTNVLWYNKPLLGRRRRHAAHDLGRAARGVHTLNAAGRHPDRDRQQGPVGGGQLARPHGLARRRRGVYAATLAGTGKFATPEWEKAFGYITQLADAQVRQRRAPTRSTTTPARSCSSRARPPCTRSARGW